MSRVMQDIRDDTEASKAQSTNGTGGKEKGGGKDAKNRDNGDGKGRGENGASLALPKNVVEEGVRITRESLEGVCEVVGIGR